MHDFFFRFFFVSALFCGWFFRSICRTLCVRELKSNYIVVGSVSSLLPGLINNLSILLRCSCTFCRNFAISICLSGKLNTSSEISPTMIQVGYITWPRCLSSISNFGLRLQVDISLKCLGHRIQPLLVET